MLIIHISVPNAFTSLIKGWGRLKSFFRKTSSRAGGNCISLVLTSAYMLLVGNQEYEKISLSTNLSFKSTIVGLNVFLSTCLEEAIDFNVGSESVNNLTLILFL